MSRTFYEFFAGGGMVRAGLGSGWTCLLANDFDRKKAETYRLNWGGDGLIVDDIRNIGPDEMPGRPDLVWGSFPCQDLSLAGGGAGLGGGRSGTFWPFVYHVRTLSADGRAPAIVALENVPGTLTSHGGRDFTAICQALTDLGYRFGAVVVDAARFVPQSRPRLFVIALRRDLLPAPSTRGEGPTRAWHSSGVTDAHARLPDGLASDWIWWKMPEPVARSARFADLVEDHPDPARWHKPVETTALLSMMSEVNLAKVETARASGVRMVGTLYRRTRQEHGIKVQRAEIRFDDIAGCLRTPAGGSSRQSIMLIEGDRIRSRLISARETARLMGLPDTYRLPTAYNEAYHLTGDGVVVPVVRHIAEHLLEVLLTRVDAPENLSTA